MPLHRGRGGIGIFDGQVDGRNTLLPLWMYGQCVNPDIFAYLNKLYQTNEETSAWEKLMGRTGGIAVSAQRVTAKDSTN